MKIISLATCIFLALLVGQLGSEVATAAGFNYGDALDKSLMFFEAQRSGKLPLNQRIKWRADSGLRDGFLENVNLVGGYYDAGDNVKFGLPMAFSVSMLAWGAIEFRKEITALNQMEHTLWAIRWGTDYFMKAHTQPNVLWGQVGDGDSDHYCWERPEDMTTSRKAYKIDPEHPGSDLAGETAAALAAASIVFRPYNSSYSNLLLVHAKQLFSFADRFRGEYDESIQCSKNFYSSSGYADELLWAAAWLHRATKEECYLKYVVDNAVSLGGTGWAVREFSWDNKYAGLQILLSKVLMDGEGGAYTSTLKQYQAKADFFSCSCVQKNDGYNVPLTPGGLIYLHEWNNMQYVSSAAFLLSVYSDYLTKANAVLKCPDAVVKPQDLLNFAKSQVDYILGQNPKSMSYLVGYGPKFPIHVHHRGASIDATSLLNNQVTRCVQGFEEWYRRPEANPNVIYGALVGGPDNKDNFFDDRSNYEQTEPTLCASAPLVGLFSKLQSINGENSGSRPYVTPKPSPKTGDYVTPKPSPKTDVVVPVEFLHSISSTWTVGKMTYYRHKVTIKNKLQKPVTDLKLVIENLSGTIYGLSLTKEKNTYELPQWLKVLKPGSECSFVYVQGGPQAKVSILSYH